jgi:hypothetical protein
MTPTNLQRTEYCSYHGKWYTPARGCRSCKLGKPHDPSSCDCLTCDSWEQAAKDVEALQRIVAERQIRQRRLPAVQCPTHGNFFEQGARCYICDGGTPIDQKVCCGAYRDCDCPKCQKSGLAKFNKVQPVVKTVETVSAPPDATDAQKQFVIWLNQYREERRND